MAARREGEIEGEREGEGNRTVGKETVGTRELTKNNATHPVLEIWSAHVKAMTTEISVTVQGTIAAPRPRTRTNAVPPRLSGAVATLGTAALAEATGIMVPAVEQRGRAAVMTDIARHIAAPIKNSLAVAPSRTVAVAEETGIMVQSS